MRGKDGAVEWSVGKLMSIVLLMVVLALVIYGVSSGGLKPLIDRARGAFDEVLLFFGVGEDGGNGDVECGVPYLKSIDGVGSGMLLKCRGKCTWTSEELVSGYKEFGVFGEMSVGNFMGDSFKLNNDIVDVTKVDNEREVYRELRGVFYSVLRGVDVESEEVGIKEDASADVKSLMEPWDTALYLSVPESDEKLLLKYEVGDGRIGYWYVFEEGVWRDFKGDPWDKLLVASDQGLWDDNEVYWRVGSGPDDDLSIKGTGISSVPVSDYSVVWDEVGYGYRILPGMVGHEGEIDGEEDLGPFKNWFNMKTDLLKSNSVEKVQRLRDFDNDFRDVVVGVDGEEYNVLIDSDRDRPFVHIFSDPRYGIYVYDDVFVLEESSGGADWDGSENMGMIVLSDDEWEERVVINKIYDFMEGNC